MLFLLFYSLDHLSWFSEKEEKVRERERKEARPKENNTEQNKAIQNKRNQQRVSISKRVLFCESEGE
jgi:hypothetical protein